MTTQLDGLDVFVQHKGQPKVPKQAGELKLTMVSNRGTKLWTDDGTLAAPMPEEDLADVHRCRYIGHGKVTDRQLFELLGILEQAGFHWVSATKLFSLKGKPAYSN